MPNIIVNTATEPDVRGRSPIVLGFQWDYSLPSGTYPLCNVPAGYRVAKVVTTVTQAFDGAPTATIGDGDDVDGFLTSANIAPGTAETVTTPACKDSAGIANPYQFGKRYNVADTVDVVWAKGTNPTAGIIKGEIHMINTIKDGVPASGTSTTKA